MRIRLNNTLYNFTHHAYERLQQRNIDMGIVEKVMRDGIIVPSNSRKDAHIFYWNRYRVILAPRTNTIISVMWGRPYNIKNLKLKEIKRTNFK